MKTCERALILIGDGMGDRPVASKGGKTPLEAAATPNLDRLAEMGICGIMDPISPGIRAGSDTAHLAILGYDPYKYYTGRGPFEVLGIGMDVRQGDVALRGNFSTVDADMHVIDRRAGRIKEGTHELAEALDGLEFDGVTCLVKESIEHRAALLLRGEGLSGAIGDVDPHEEGAKIHRCEPKDPSAAKTAAVLDKFVAKSYEILKDHPVNKEREKQGLPPANILLPRGAGLAPHLGRFEDRYGFTGACVVEVGLVKGIGRYLSMEVVDVVGSTGGVDTDMSAVVKAATDALDRHPFVLCNIKAPDLSGHDGDFDQKVDVIQRIDEAISVLLSNEMANTVIVVTADHATPVSVMDHSGDPVPVLMCGAGVATDSVKSFGERSAAQGGLGRVHGFDIMPMVTNLIGRQEKFGA